MTSELIKKIKMFWQKYDYRKICEAYQFVPIVSGVTALAFLGKIIFSDLKNPKYWIAILAILVVFCVSSLLFYLLKRSEQDKDKYLLSTVGKIVEDVFRHYG